MVDYTRAFLDRTVETLIKLTQLQNHTYETSKEKKLCFFAVCYLGYHGYLNTILNKFIVIFTENMEFLFYKTPQCHLG